MSLLLKEYYDPLYNKGLSGLGREVLFRGDFKSIKEYLEKTVKQKYWNQKKGSYWSEVDMLTSRFLRDLAKNSSTWS